MASFDRELDSMLEELAFEVGLDDAIILEGTAELGLSVRDGLVTVTMPTEADVEEEPAQTDGIAMQQGIEEEGCPASDAQDPIAVAPTAPAPATPIFEHPHDIQEEITCITQCESQAQGQPPSGTLEIMTNDLKKLASIMALNPKPVVDTKPQDAT